MRMKDSLLEFVRDLRQTLGLILKLVRKDSAVLVLRNYEDWHLIEETLRLDAESGNFDRDLRKDLERALNGARDIPDVHASLAPLRLKAARFEALLARRSK